MIGLLKQADDRLDRIGREQSMTDHLKSTLPLMVVGLLAFAGARADGLQLDPSVACDLMATEGLRTLGGYRGSGDWYQCQSQRRSLISGEPLNNSIRFVARGNAQAVTQLVLELQVNAHAGAQRTHRQMVDYSQALVLNALDTEMPEEIKAAILSAVAGRWALADYDVSLERIVLGAPGYQLRLSIQ